jgi:hypothetical protein
MQPQSIREMSNLRAVTALAGQDYVQGKLDHITHFGRQFTDEHQNYVPAANYDKAWFSQNNRNTYMAAVNAMNGKPFEEWSKGLSEDEGRRALGVVARLDPTATVQGQNGHPLPVAGFVPRNMGNPGGAVAR